MRQIADRNRVALDWLWGRPALSCLLSVHFLHLLKKRQLGRALAGSIRYLAAEGRFSRLYLRTRWQRWFASRSQAPHYPGWLNRDLEKMSGSARAVENVASCHRSEGSGSPYGL